MLSFELLGLDRALTSPSNDELASISQTNKNFPMKSSEKSVGQMMVETQSKFSAPSSASCLNLVQNFEDIMLISARLVVEELS
jgi:hypothetical protein